MNRWIETFQWMTLWLASTSLLPTLYPASWPTGTVSWRFLRSHVTKAFQRFSPKTSQILPFWWNPFFFCLQTYVLLLSAVAIVHYKFSILWGSWLSSLSRESHETSLALSTFRTQYGKHADIMYPIQFNNYWTPTPCQVPPEVLRKETLVSKVLDVKGLRGWWDWFIKDAPRMLWQHRKVAGRAFWRKSLQCQVLKGV